MKHLLSVPPGVVSHFHRIAGLPGNDWFVSCDPGGRNIGSGGGTAHLLASLFEREKAGDDFRSWLRGEKRMIVHAGGKSRRLPAYAPLGKSLIPVPVFRWSRGQKIGQRLIGLQTPLFEKILGAAPPALNTLIASGDVLIRNSGLLPPVPDADVVCFGMWIAPEKASRHGVFFARQSAPGDLDFMLQKPPVRVIQQHVHTHFFLMDIGIWLLNDRAVGILMEKCGWKEGRFQNGVPADYDLYGTFGPALGKHPDKKDDAVNSLRTALVNLTDGEFYHFGNSRELITSNEMLQNRVLDQRAIWNKKIKTHPSIFILNSPGEFQANENHRMLWIENSHIPSSWKLSENHILTGIPETRWSLSLPAGACLDAVPVNGGTWAIRNYGFDDAFSGNPNDPATRFMNEPLGDWLAKRGLQPLTEAYGAIDDISSLPLFPVISPEEEDGSFIQWLIDKHPVENQAFTMRWLNGTRFSAAGLAEAVSIGRLEEQRGNNLRICLPLIEKNHSRSIFYQLDLEDLAEEYVRSGLPLPGREPENGNSFDPVHHRMFRGAVLRGRDLPWEEDEQRAFGLLRESILATAASAKQVPGMQLLEDQITWARSPVRLDLAGGWSDTPPYCILYGGQVVNVAVELNGQPPLQCFIRRRPEPVIVVRSIDLGMQETLSTWSDIRSYRNIQSAFSIPKAALALAGFLPEHCGAVFPDLKAQLLANGGGMEITILSAVPKGSGLGTSSILAATVLGALSDACGLGWDKREIGNRTLALEQLLTTGGGWQDQFGGILEGIKFLETKPGYDQVPAVRWLPGSLFTKPEYTGSILLYYTGITRVAKTILGEIVRGMFLNSSRLLPVLHDIREHGRNTFEALQHNSYEALGEMVKRSWNLNRQLDNGTNPPEIQQIAARVEPHAYGLKLLGAGGGGYMLMIARSRDDASAIRKMLSEETPGGKARFVEMTLSERGLQVSRS